MNAKTVVLLGSLLLATAAMIVGDVADYRIAMTTNTSRNRAALEAFPVQRESQSSRLQTPHIKDMGEPQARKLLQKGLRQQHALGHSKNGADVIARGRRCDEALTGDAIIDLTNGVRKAYGLPLLSESRLLDSVAEARARDMAEKGYFAHVSPSGEKVSHFAQRTGYRYMLISENIAAGGFHSNRTIVNCWTGSAVHRLNILSHHVSEIGAAVVRGRINGSEMWIAVQVFGVQSVSRSGMPLAGSSARFWREFEINSATMDGLLDQLRGTWRDLEIERKSIESAFGTWTDENDRSPELNPRIKAYNEKAEQYNRSLKVMKAMRTALNSKIEEHEAPAAQAANADNSHSE
jgi:uncharacterized protein YkwD